MKIVSVLAHLVRIPLASPYVISRGMLDAFTNVVTEMRTDEGLIGYGEAVPVSLIGDPVQFKSVIDTRLAPRVIGRDPADIESIVDDCLVACDGVVAAVAGIDLALWDLVGQALRVPVSTLLGGGGLDSSAARPGVLVDYTMSVDTPEAMAHRAREVSAFGFPGVVVKVDCKSIDVDVARVRAVRDALPQTSTMRVDCNGGYTPEQAFAFIDRIAGMQVEFIEQPVHASDLAGLKACRGRGLRVAADESLSTPLDALRLVSADACDVLNVKVPKAGGLLQSKRIAAIASAASLPLVVGGGLTFGISRFASQHLAASCTSTVGHCHEGPGPASQALIDDLTTPRVTRQQVGDHAGRVPVSTLPGLGCAVDPQKIAHYRIA
ncbi:enolase C-terminal domain-like protein [Robbsia sp. KACC 23696]|uniref:mandelate racemase/muconate lactonizing enzyme family protein n=1 Tax=Robbsia sp. KACC 23696 TaxID=3149231 RepID=UPI00325A806B